MLAGFYFIRANNMQTIRNYCGKLYYNTSTLLLFLFQMLDAPSAHKGTLGSQSKTGISDDDIEHQLAQLKAL